MSRGGCRVLPGWEILIVGGVLHTLDWTGVHVEPEEPPTPTLRVERAGEGYHVRFPTEVPCGQAVRPGDVLAHGPDGTRYNLDWSRADAY